MKKIKMFLMAILLGHLTLACEKSESQKQEDSITTPQLETGTVPTTKGIYIKL